MKVTKMNKERGGTILGLVIGIVLGLAVALAVAVFVTKTPPSFANKGQAHSLESDANESKKNKDWDPNAALQGKNPAKPTPPVVPDATTGAGAVIPAPAPTPNVNAKPDKPAKDTAAPVATKPSIPASNESKPAANLDAKTPVVDGSLGPSVATSTTKPLAKAEAKPEAKPATTSDASDPLGDLMKAKSETKSSNQALEPFIYFVQAGAYRTAEDAEAQRARLSLAGINTKVTEREQAGRTVYRVRSGPFNKEEDAERMKAKISATGADAALVRAQR